MSQLTLKRLQGSEIIPYLLELANLRITVFRDYPYLYMGNLEYEKKYLTTYSNCQDFVLILVFDQNKIVGASTALPLKNEPEHAQKPFRDAHININDIFYLGESVLLREYRGQKIYPKLFAEREAAAKEQGYKITAFCAVERELNHPRRPKDWKPLDSYWERMGYHKHPELKAYYTWKEIDEEIETPKPMMFWLKTL